MKKVLILWIYILTNLFTVIVLLFILLGSCKSESIQLTDAYLFTEFQNPPAEARPFVRWWWNGNKVNAEELDRELELLKAVGFGGVEINPVAMPNGVADNGDEALVWMSDEWIDMFVHACKKTKDLGMVVDMIVGTGWPFGGEFLQMDETCQRMAVHNIPYRGGTTITIDETELVSKLFEDPKNRKSKMHHYKNATHKMHHIRLVPENCSNTNQTIDLLDQLKSTGKIDYNIDQPGNYHLCYGLLEQNFKEVYLGAPGGAGPVMDHYKKDVTLAYLSRLKRIAEKSGIPLSELLRALFCDSIEISGANWTDDFSQLFYETYGYSLDEWFPFIFYSFKDGYLKEDYDAQFSVDFRNQLKRVRFDYNNLLVETFLGNFTQVFQNFCTENNLLCRYQAYGTPFLMGILDGYMIPDIPESNNWIYSAEMKDSIWQWNQNHGYMTWNMFTAAGGHLKNRKIISCEAMTNTNGVFKTTLEEIKQHDDMNFISGINHSVMHGFNYSPIDVEFPGWVRYGTYFSERNPWWKHLHHWVVYNARLSYMFQNSQADKSIAIVGPVSDLWGDEGLGRTSFHTKPEYLFKLWEPISQLGYSCEYINQGVLEGATINNGTISYGNMNYKLLVLASLKSLNPKAASAIKTFVKSGGKVVVIDQLPIKSLSFKEYEKNDVFVQSTMETLLADNPKSFIQISAPKDLDQLLTWTQRLLNDSELAADVVINKSQKYIYQIHQYTANKELYFFTNNHRFKSESFDAVFPVDGKYPYLWNPETGERKPYHYASKPNELHINLNPLQSILLVFEDEKPAEKASTPILNVKASKVVDGLWTVVGDRIDNKVFEWEMTELIDFSKSNDPTQKSFGGSITYKTTINNVVGFTHVDLGDTNEGVTELFVNDQKVGTHWYGKALYPVADYLKDGENEIEVRYTTVLANYCKSIDNPLTNGWTRRYNDYVPIGLQGPVNLLTY